MDNNPDSYFSWHPTLFLKNQRTSFHSPLFFRTFDSTFEYQLKTFQCFSLQVSQHPIPSASDLLSNSLITKSSRIISSATECPIKIHQKLPSDVIDPAPNLSNVGIHNIQSAYRLFQTQTAEDYSFAFYAQAQLHHYGIVIPQNYAMALNIYQKGCEAEELGCMLKVIRITVEPDLAAKFKTSIDVSKALGMFIKVFIVHGFFDYFSAREPSLKQYVLFNIYMDIFPEFKSLVKKAAFTKAEDPIWNSILRTAADKEYIDLAKPVLQLLSEQTLFTSTSIEALNTLYLLAEAGNLNAYFLLGDLHDNCLYGFSSNQCLEKRLQFYSKADTNGGNKIASIRLFSILKYTDQEFISSHPQWKNSEYYLSKLENFQGIDCLRKKVNDLTSNLLSQNILEELRSTHELLYFLSDRKTISNYFRILKYLKLPSAYDVAKLMKDKKISFYELSWGYCHEKGIGTDIDYLKTIQVYQEGYEKLISTKIESKSFLYYRIGSTLLKTTLAMHAQFLFDLAADDLFMNLKHNPLNIGLLNELSKLLIKGRGLPKRIELAYELMDYVINFKPANVVDNFTLLFVRRRLDKMKKLGLVVPEDEDEENPTDDNVEKPDKKMNIISKVTRIYKERQESQSTIKGQDNESKRTMIQETFKNAVRTLKSEHVKKDDDMELSSRLESRNEQSYDNTKGEMSSFRDSIKRFSTRPSVNDHSSSAIKDEDASIRKEHRLSMKQSFQSESMNDKNVHLPLTFLVEEMKKHGVLQRELNTNERIQTLLDYHRRKSYNLLAQQLKISDQAKLLIYFLKDALTEYTVGGKGRASDPKDVVPSSKEEIFEKLVITILDILEQIAKENHLRIFTAQDYSVRYDEKLRRNLATYNENGQLFELKEVTFSALHVAELIVEAPTLFYKSLLFLHPQYFPIYGLSYYLEEDNKIKFNYFMEPRKDSLEGYLNSKEVKTAEKITMILEILYAMHSFHMMNISLLTLNIGNFAVTSDNEAKLFEIFLPVFDLPTNIDSTSSELRTYIGELDNLSPEIFRTNGRMSTASDIYCLGLLMYHIMTGCKLYSFSEFKNETDFCNAIKSGFIKTRVAELKASAIREHKIPQIIEDLILACLSFHKKKRPTTEQLIFCLNHVHQMLTSSKAQQTIKINLQDSAKHPFVTPYNLQSVIDKQCRALHMTMAIDEDECYFLFPGSAEYKGQTVRKLPSGEGEMHIKGLAKCKGEFQKGFLHGKGNVYHVLRDENMTGEYADGLPVSFDLSSLEGLHTSLKHITFEKGSYIMSKELRERLITGYDCFNPSFTDYVKFRAENFGDDTVNINSVNKYVQMFLETDTSITKKANMVDCYGGFYYLQNPMFASTDKISSYIVRQGFLFPHTLRIYNSDIKRGFMYQSSLNGTDLYSMKGKLVEPIKYPLLMSFEEMIRFYHFGYRFRGKMENGNLKKGVVQVNYNSHFWYEAPKKLYQGANYVKDTNCVYLGTLLNNKAEGFGTEYVAKMKKYEGQYHRGYPQGKGSVYTNTGEVEFSGYLEKGKPFFGLYTEGKKIYEGKFSVISASGKDAEESRRQSNFEDKDKQLHVPWIIY